MTTVSAYSYTHSVTYVADNVLKSLKDIIRLSGMDPTKLTNVWESTHNAIRTWLASEHLEKVVLEVYNPVTNALALRWDIDIVYQWSSSDGAFYTDTDQLRYYIKKAGVAPASASYDILLKNKPGWPAVAGWGAGSFRATDGMIRQSLGSTIEHSGLGGSAAYWRTR
ncbi:HORMA domain containing protein [Aromatoleum toluclasticum]|uniref:HORMA domain containing protein n=1 Tax=Aromatoleum toluclasticum TaxID=92003 RepID=UPI001D18F633|nr:HORMA domain containing protein [Aromatoleum toluclasticum]MCC4118581.1 HORMA domain containing protein [Aromatoleum toluclasticum]